MSKYLCTFSGKYGDILWSLPTAKFIAEKVVNQPVDFAVMPYYDNLLPLLVEQSYIENAFVIQDWVRQHSNHGDQPWEAPKQEGYEQTWHLTYKGHPGISAPAKPLVDFVAWQQGITLQDPIPFLSVDRIGYDAHEITFSSGSLPQVAEEGRLIAYSFNEQYKAEKDQFFDALWKNRGELEFINVGTMGWKEAAWVISRSTAFVGCRSANWVVAIGLGKETITYEPHPSRHKENHLGMVFGCPYGIEHALPYRLPPAPAGEAAASMLKSMAQRLKQETVNVESR